MASPWPRACFPPTSQSAPRALRPIACRYSNSARLFKIIMVGIWVCMNVCCQPAWQLTNVCSDTRCQRSTCHLLVGALFQCRTGDKCNGLVLWLIVIIGAVTKIFRFQFRSDAPNESTPGLRHFTSHLLAFGSNSGICQPL
jgi:hypothetical protein